jgi:two-component system, chemotaxis family, protein-glutamate methylesterase/glutaminase
VTPPRRGGTLRVLVVDDSAVVRQALSYVLSHEPGFEVTTAADPLIALRKMQDARPHVIVLDLEMPRMHGLEFLRRVMAADPIPVVVCSGLTAGGTESALQALELGAVDIVSKPGIGIRDFMHESAVMLIDKIRAAAQARVVRRVPQRRAPARNTADAVLPRPPRGAARTGGAAPVVAIGASTGGTEAIRDLLEALPPSAPPILVVQHMPEHFTAAFARRLDSICRIEVKEAEAGDDVVPGRALIAPGNRHLLLRRAGARFVAGLHDGPLVSRHRPSVDVLFRSMAAAAGAGAIGLILTGMGDDGADGLLEMRERGALTIAQDEASCVVFGMPGAAVARGAVQQVLPLTQLADAILRPAFPPGSPT